MSISIFKTCRPLAAAAIFLAVSVLGSLDAVAKEPSLAERVKLLEDKEAITHLLERFYEYQESRNVDAFANLFSKDGEMILRQGTSKGGPAGIKAGMSRGANPDRAPPPERAARPARTEMRHIMSNVHIVVNGDTATAVSRFTLLAESEDKRTRVGGTGRYFDKLVRENGEWKFQQRILYRDIPNDGKPASAAPVDMNQNK
jgi:hypothetical protein